MYLDHRIGNRDSEDLSEMLWVLELASEVTYRKWIQNWVHLYQGISTKTMRKNAQAKQMIPSSRTSNHVRSDSWFKHCSYSSCKESGCQLNNCLRNNIYHLSRVQVVEGWSIGSCRVWISWGDIQAQAGKQDACARDPKRWCQRSSSVVEILPWER